MNSVEEVNVDEIVDSQRERDTIRPPAGPELEYYMELVYSTRCPCTANYEEAPTTGLRLEVVTAILETLRDEALIRSSTDDRDTAIPPTLPSAQLVA